MSACRVIKIAHETGTHLKEMKLASGDSSPPTPPKAYYSAAALTLRSGNNGGDIPHRKPLMIQRFDTGPRMS